MSRIKGFTHNKCMEGHVNRFRIYRYVKKKQDLGHTGFTILDVSEDLEIGDSATRGHINALEELGMIKKVSRINGSSPRGHSDYNYSGLDKVFR